MAIEHDQTKEPTIFNSLLLCFLVTILLFIALLFRQKDLSLLSLLILLVMGGAKIWSNLNIYRISCTCREDRNRVFPGETVSMESTLANHKFLPVWLRLSWPLQGAFQPVDPMDSFSRHGAGLLWHQQMRIQQKFIALRRGVFNLGPPLLGSSDFFGFFQKGKRLGKPVQVLVYPRLVPVRAISLPKQDWFDTPGAGSPVKDPIYILGTRDYQPSGPSRHIHWKASARHSRLQEKVFEPSEFGRILLVVDVGSFEKNQAPDAFEHTLEVVASLSVKLDQSGQAVGLTTNGLTQDRASSTVTPARSSRQLPLILEVLARLQMRRHKPMAHTIRRAPFKRHGVSCALFSYAYGKDTADAKHLLKRQRIPVAVFVCRFESLTDSHQAQDLTGIHPLEDIRLQEETRP